MAHHEEEDTPPGFDPRGRMRDTYTVRQTAQLKLFADLAGEPWQQGKLVDRSEHTRGRPPDRSAGCERACLTMTSLPHFSWPGAGDGAH